MRILAMVLLLFCTGCSTKIHVTSNTYWRGEINGGIVDGHGNRTFEYVEQEGYKPCVYFRKHTEAGYLRVQVAQPWQDDSAQETREPFGEVGVCVK